MNGRGCRRNQTTQKTRKQNTFLGAGNLYRAVGGKGDRGHEDHQPPDFVRIERLPGTVSLVWKNRENNDRHQQELEGGGQLRSFNSLEPTVKEWFEAEQDGCQHRPCGGYNVVAANREGAEHKRNHCCNKRRDAVVFADASLSDVRDGEKHYK